MMPLTSAILAALEVSHPLFFVFDTELRLCHVGPRYAQLVLARDLFALQQPCQ